LGRLLHDGDRRLPRDRGPPLPAGPAPRRPRRRACDRCRMKTLKYVVPGLAFLVIAGFLLVGLGRNPSEIPSPLIGKPAPAWALPGLPGGEATLLRSEALAGEPYLLNVWASWCGPCLQEHPQLVALARQELVRIVGINYKDRPED